MHIAYSVRRHLLPPLVAPPRSALFAGALLVALARVSAAESPRPITPQELLARVRETDPRLAALRARVAAARGEPRGTRLWANPTLSWRREEVSSSGVTASDSFLELSLPLDVSGRRSHRASALEAAADAVEGDAAGQRLEVELSALATYRDAAWARERAGVLRAGRDALARAAANLRRRNTEGDASGYELGRLEIELAAFDDLLAEAETELNVARRTLARVAGMPAATLEPATPLETPAEPSSVDAMLTEAMAARGDRQAALARLRQENESSIVASRGWIPGFELGGGSKSTRTAGEAASGYTAGVGLTFPLFDRGQVDRARAEARLGEARAALAVVERLIRGDVQDADTRLADRIVRVKRLDAEQLPRTEQLLRRAEALFREGEIAGFELVDAHRTARDTHLRALELRWQASRGELELWRALGRKP